METYAAPLWDKELSAIDIDDVLECLSPIWGEKHETAKRLRGRIERLLDAAKAKGLRKGENPARWRGHLSATLPNIKLKVEHHAALPYSDVPALMVKLQANKSLAALVLRFLILTGARSAEARGALWSEVDMEAKLWTLPPRRMKGDRKHIVPLSDAALAVLAEMKVAPINDFVFPGQSPGKPISETAIRSLLKRLGLALVETISRDGEVTFKPVTQHGFRSTMRDWAGDKTSFSREVAEASIAHTVGNKVEQAYRRGDALEKRRALMATWADYCCGGGAEVVKLHG